MSDLYACLLEDEPSHLVPEWLLEEMWTLDPSQPVILNPDARFEGATRDAGGYVPESVYRDAWTLWVTDPLTHSRFPYVLGAQSVTAIRGVSTSHPRPLPISPRLWRSLFFASILMRQDHVAARVEDWNATIGRNQAAFAARGFVPIRGLVHPFHLSALRRYFRRRIRKGAFPLGDRQSQLRYCMHNEGVARFVHHQLTSVVNQMAGRRLKPSYVYFASYQAGAELQKHIDRPQCEYTVSLCIDFSPEPSRESPWPLQLESASESIVVYQAIGDALLYKGCELAHFRDELPHGCTSTSLFLHYVDEDFAGSLV
jgi:hypothetical protein